MRTNIPIILTCLSILLSACVQKMGKDGHLNPLEQGPASILTTRMPPIGTVPQNLKSTQLDTTNQSNRVKGIITYSKKNLKSGQESYNIYCMPCHGMSGYGNGIIVQRGFLAPPSYHTDRLRNLPDQHYYDVISNGYGAMYSYSDRVSEEERWKIIGYIRALQLSQNAQLGDLRIEDQKKLEELQKGQK